MKKARTISANEAALLLLGAALVFGAWLRLAPAASVDFPMNDGGMFYVMIRDLRANVYALPAYTSYNQLNIPFAYSPLPFYLAGGLADLFHLSDLAVLIWLPAIVNVLTTPAFFWLARELLGERLKAALATLFYALTPLSMDWFLMGGGLTRGIGQLLLILTCLCALKLFRGDRKALLPTSLCGALVLLSHPESALLAVTSVFVIWIFSGRLRAAFGDAVLAGLGAAILCAPWLFVVVRQHGLEPFLQAMRTSGNSLFLWMAVFPFNFTQETGLPFLAILGLTGLFISAARKQWMLPAWVLLPFFTNPRSAARASIIPLSILAAICLWEVLLTAIRAAQPEQKTHRNLAGILFGTYILLYMLVSGFFLDDRMAANRLMDPDRQAMQWVRENTPPGSQVLILTGESQLMRDPILEWFPALAERQSVLTLQGREWIAGDAFMQAIKGYQALLGCLREDLVCLERESGRLGITFDHVYIHKMTTSGGEDYPGRALVNELTDSGKYYKVFENDAAVIFTHPTK